LKSKCGQSKAEANEARRTVTTYNKKQTKIEHGTIKGIFPFLKKTSLNLQYCIQMLTDK
jgi:hypothetical protein